MLEASASLEDPGVKRAIREQRAFVDQLSRDPAMETAELDEIARVITEACARLLGLERVGIWVFDEHETELRCIDQFTRSKGAHTSGDVLFEQEFRSEFLYLKSSLYVDANDPWSDPRTAGYVDGYLKANQRISSMLDVVIRFGGKNFGTICLEHVDQPHVWAQHEIDFGCLVGGQLSVLLERREVIRTEAARREAQERLVVTQELAALKNRFLANISHEFRTPLTLLIGPVEDLLSSHEPDASSRSQLVTIHRSALRLLKLVTALLDFVRADAGRLPAVFEPTDLAVFTRELAGLFEFAVGKADIRLRVDCSNVVAPAYVDREMWEKIVLNLVSNALKYTFEGEIAIALREVGADFELVVRDTGVGIAAEELPHVFERFYRVPDARGRTVEGAGIGLALVKDLVTLHGGTIDVESTPNVGSTFRIRIPTGDAHLPADRVRHDARDLTPPSSSQLAFEAIGWLAGRETLQVDRAPLSSARRSRILVADDNADMRAYLARLLATSHEVEVVADGVEALEAARARPPDLVLSDVMMPRLDGVGLVRALRADPATRTVPVVLVSARTGEDVTVEALDAAADDYLRKPFSARELLARVATHLALAEARREAAESALKDVFLGIAAHELSTPLTNLKLRIDMARGQLEKANTAQASQYLALVDRSIARIEGLAGELLSVSAVQSGRIQLTREQVDLVQIVRTAAAEESAALARPIALDLPRAPVPARVDGERIGEAIRHLLSNALKYSPFDRPVHLSLRADDGEATISVRDEGPGIPGEELPHMFDRFHRIPSIPVHVGSKVGLGLGLYIAKAMVDAHHGKITIETIQGRGSTFTMTLPREGDA